MKQVVSTLLEVIEGIDAEQENAKTLAKDRAKKCEKSIANMEKAIKDNERIAAEAKEDLQATDAEAATVTTLIDGIKNQISTANEEIGRLTERLGDLRAAHKEDEKQASSSLQQLEMVLSKSQLSQKEEGKRKRHAPRPTSQLSAEVFALQELGKKLSYSSSPGGGNGAPSAPSFLQMGEADVEADVQAGQGQGGQESGEAIAVLQADTKELEKAKKGASKGFDEEEKKLINLIRIQREELKKLEKSWEDQQPVVAEKLKQSAEINTTLAMAERSLDRDKTLLPLAQDLCTFTAAGVEAEVKTRSELSNLVAMPSKILEGMDTGSFLARDMESIRDLPAAPPPSLVQVSMEASRKRRRRRRHSKRVHHAHEAAASVSLSQEVQQALDSAAEQQEPTTLALKDDASREEEKSNDAALLQSATAALTAGPFDKVSNMIEALITSLREQINDDTDHHQMCEESTLQNQRTRLETKDNIDMMMTDIHWSETGISRLDSQIAAVEEDIPRLKAVASGIQEEFNAEKSRVDEETADRETSKEICSKVVVVLMELCELDDSDVALLQENRTSLRSGSRTGSGIVALVQLRATMARSSKIKQCSEAAKLLNEAVAKFDELNTQAGDYISSYRSKSDDAHGVASTMAQLRESDLSVTKASRAKRANELALARDFLKAKQKDLSLIEEEKMQLDQSCGPQVDSHEERMARRAEEIDSLKNALSVLEGEAVPVG
jgi:hypothetical protein